MKSSDKISHLLVNLALWAVATVMPSTVEVIATGSGHPPKFYAFLIPLVFMGLAGASTCLLASAMRKPEDK